LYIVLMVVCLPHSLPPTKAPSRDPSMCNNIPLFQSSFLCIYKQLLHHCKNLNEWVQ
jgi:hypothetical protein